MSFVFRLKILCSTLKKVEWNCSNVPMFQCSNTFFRFSIFYRLNILLDKLLLTRGYLYYIYYTNKVAHIYVNRKIENFIIIIHIKNKIICPPPRFSKCSGTLEHWNFFEKCSTLKKLNGFYLNPDRDWVFFCEFYSNPDKSWIILSKPLYLLNRFRGKPFNHI